MKFGAVTHLPVILANGNIYEVCDISKIFNLNLPPNHIGKDDTDDTDDTDYFLTFMTQCFEV